MKVLKLEFLAQFACSRNGIFFSQ